MGYSLCMIADFQNALLFRIVGLFLSGILHRTTVNVL